jgi:excisionase family DNA binding protein
MQFERNRMYRVKAVAEALDVSVATIYRAIEAGKLNAFKIGTGKGALRIPGEAVPAYLQECAHTAYEGALAHGGER